MRKIERNRAFVARFTSLGGRSRAADLGTEGCRQLALDAFRRLDADGKERERAGQFCRKMWDALAADPERRREYLAFRGRVKTLNFQRRAAGLKPVYGEKAKAMLKQLDSYYANQARRKAASTNSKTTEAA